LQDERQRAVINPSSSYSNHWVRAYEIPDATAPCSERISVAWQRLLARVVPLISRDIPDRKRDPENSEILEIPTLSVPSASENHDAGINSTVTI
jgi:hypothetical protein